MIYWQIYREWLIKLVHERIYLSKKGFRPELLLSANQRKALIDYNGYRNDRTMAGFMIRKYKMIEQLIPKNKAYETQIRLPASFKYGNRTNFFFVS